MLECKIDGRKGDVQVNADGNLPEILSNITILLNVVYDGLKGDGAKEAFVYSIEEMARDKIYTKNSDELAVLAIKRLIESLKKGKENDNDNKDDDDFRKKLRDILK